MARRLAAVTEQARRGVAIVRVSKAKGREDLISPELQRTAITDYAARAGIEIVEWVEVLDESASQNRSPWWKRLEQIIASVEAGERDVVLVWKFSRAARNRRRWAVAIDRLEVAGGTIESATEGLDTTTSTGRLARGMLAELAAWESDVKSEQWKETQDRRRRMGLPHSGGPRFGYLYDKHEGYRPDPDLAPVLVSLYRRYAAGEGFQALTVWLNANAVPTMRGAPWSVQTVLRQLDSGFAAGLLHIHSTGEMLPGAHEPLLTEQEWLAYQQRREERRRLPARARNPRYVLTGLVKCGLCGGSLSAYTHRGVVGGRYRCVNYTSRRDCQGVWIGREVVERAVHEWLQREANDIDRRAASKTARRAAATSVKVDKARLARVVEQLDKQLNRLTVDLSSGLVPPAAYRAARDEIAEQREAAAEALAAAVREAQALGGRGHEALLKGLAQDWSSLGVTERRDLLKTYLLRRVEVHREEPRVRPVPMWVSD
jgi:site-specific DNA recombinase